MVGIQFWLAACILLIRIRMGPMNQFSETTVKTGTADLPPICAMCPWLEWREGEPRCINYKTLLCRLAPASVIERYFEFRVFSR